MGGGGDARHDVESLASRRVDRDVRQPVLLEEREACRLARPPRPTSGGGTRSAGRAGRAGARPAASSSSASRDFLKRGGYWSSTPRSFPDCSSGASASRNSRNAVSRSASSWPVISPLAFAWKTKPSGCPLGPLGGRLGGGEAVERRVDLDRVEALGVVGEPCRRRGDARGYQCLTRPSSAQLQVPRRITTPGGSSPRGGARPV